MILIKVEDCGSFKTLIGVLLGRHEPKVEEFQYSRRVCDRSRKSK